MQPCPYLDNSDASVLILFSSPGHVLIILSYVKSLLLQCAPGIACATTIINAVYILFTLSSYSGWKFNDLSPQGVVITLCVCGVLGMCGYALNMPAEIKRARLTGPKLHPTKRMNLLGLVSCRLFMNC